MKRSHLQTHYFKGITTGVRKNMKLQAQYFWKIINRARGDITAVFSSSWVFHLSEKIYEYYYSLDKSPF
jgi:hypothetical protein